MTPAKNVIIGIHGVANKPERPVLERWWKQCLVDGLEGIGSPIKDFDFRLVYWADLLHSVPQHQRPNWEFDLLYNREPYVKPKPGDLKTYRASLFDRLRSGLSEVIPSYAQGLKQRVGYEGLADWALASQLHELSLYYRGRKIESRDEPPILDSARSLLRAEVTRAIKAEHAAGKRIALVAHSMGSIISYDAMREIGREPDNSVEISHFVTIGSPLGLEHVQRKVIEEWAERQDYPDGDPQLRTPTIVTQGWTNFADRMDPVTADINLASDFGANLRGVRVVDDLVSNDYHTFREGKRHENHHKSYGYLRTPEMATLVQGFLQG